MREGKEIRLDLRKNTFPENVKIVHERLNALSPWDVLITISDFNPDLIYKEINFILPELWEIEKNLNEEGLWEAKWRLNREAPLPWIDERIEIAKNSP